MKGYGAGVWKTLDFQEICLPHVFHDFYINIAQIASWPEDATVNFGKASLMPQQ